MFPLQQKELCVRKNPIPNNLEFHLRNITKLDVETNLDEISDIYYTIYRQLGSAKMDEFNSKKQEFELYCDEYPDRVVNLNTAISVLYLSGFRKDELMKRSIEYFTK